MSIIGFMLYYLLVDTSPAVVTVFKLGLLTSVIAFAFLFLFEKLKLRGKIKNQSLLLFTAVLLFVIIDQLISILTGTGFNLSITSFVTLYIICFIGMIVGKKIANKIQSRWQTPTLLNSYFTILLLSWIGWLAVSAYVAMALVG